MEHRLATQLGSLRLQSPLLTASGTAGSADELAGLATRAATVAALGAFVERTATESKNLYYDFTVSGDIVYCREAYVGADGLLAHLENVGALLGPLLKLADVQRVEVHGPAAELEKLKAPLAGLKPQWFTYLFGVKR